MTLRVLDRGVLATIQDAGRPDALHLGVPRSGACDPLAMAAANLLLGNPVDAPVLELSGGMVEFHVEADVVVAVTGADMGLRLIPDGTWLRPGTTTLALAGRRLAGMSAQHGLRTYLAFAGGLDTPRVLGSASTLPAGGFDGIPGRPLRRDDLLRPARPEPLIGAGHTWPGPGPASGIDAASPEPLIRVLDGPHRDVPGGDALLERVWMVHGASDRAGLRLLPAEAAAVEGDTVPGSDTTLDSFPLVWGAVELPSLGRPIVLLADAPTVGGYPVPFVVIGADLPVVGQSRPRDRLRFQRVDLATANAARASADANLAAAAARLRMQQAIW